MAQWVNRLWNNIFVNPLPLLLLCEISGALHPVQPGLMTGWPTGRLADEIQMNFKIFEVGCKSKYSTYYFVKPRYSLTNAFQPVISVKPIARFILKHKIYGSHSISRQFLLLSTTILNDKWRNKL